MFSIHRVVGDSMNPTLRRGQIILVRRTTEYSVDTVVVGTLDGRDVVKRITKIDNKKVFLVGDNKDYSTDSRQKGWVDKADMQGKVIWPRV